MFRKEGNTLCHVCVYSDTVRAIIGMLVPVRNKHWVCRDLIIHYCTTSSEQARITTWYDYGIYRW